MNAATIPDHVPSALIRDFDFYDMSGETDVFRHWDRIHKWPDIFYTPRNGGHWVATRHADIEEILNNPTVFSSRQASVPKFPMQVALLEYDGEKHRVFRNILAPFFTPKSVSRLEDVARDLTNTLIDGFYANGECEFIEDFAKKMPIIILMRLTAMPEEDTPYLLQISEDIVRSNDVAEHAAAFQRVAEYLATRIIPDRRLSPGDDIFSAILQSRVEGGRPLTDEEIIGLGVFLIAAGLDTVAAMLSFIVLFLAGSPEHRAQLASDPLLINDALEELLRRFQVAVIGRVVTEDIEFRGVHLKAGDFIQTPTPAAALDSNQYENPWRVDFLRKDKKHLAFGRGPHQCLGSYLARTELRVFLQEWMRRIPDFSVKEGEEPIAVPGKASAVRYLPLTWNVL